ncbi:hypothetical protein HanPI659440_Chr12g0445771 [Helianthus annuus]|nr:hypothetical protein HanPI659440_Chr12g0445771 [Helianthus annuus]
MDYNSTINYLGLLDNLTISSDVKDILQDYVKLIYESDLEEKYSKPMRWIGMYIALASLYCIFAMAADLLHGLRSKQLWFPCKYFTINAFSLSVIAIAMKLPVDLTCPMPGVVDQVAKLGSVAFMCTMMANLLPCLATMDSNALLANVTALGVMVITLAVNVCIQIHTGVVDSYKKETKDIVQMVSDKKLPGPLQVLNNVPYSIIAGIYVTMLLMLLIIHVSSSLAILKSKLIIESKYQQAHEKASIYLQQSTEELLTVEKLQKHVSNYWIMAGSGSPQFIIACFATTTASGVICGLTTILQALTMGWTIEDIRQGDYGSDYDWSMPLILIVQFVGVVLGAVAPLCRCFASLSFKVSFKSISMFFKVESYWTQKLSEWEDGSTLFPFRSYKRKVVLKKLKSLILNFCIKLQKGVVRLCNIIALIPFFYMICFLYCFRFLKWLGQAVWNWFGSGKEKHDERERGMVLKAGTPPHSIGTSQKPLGTEKLEKNPYVLQLEDEMELADRTLKGLSISLNRLIQKSEKKQPKNLMKLISKKSTIGFQGGKMFDNNDRDCSSLVVVTLTAIAVALHEINKVEVDSLLKSVREGLEYVTLVEKNLNANDNYVSIQKAAERLWQEVDVSHKWLGISLKDIASQVIITAGQEDATLQIVQLFLEKAKNKNKGVQSTEGGRPDGDSEFTYICANSMSCTTETIIDDQKESHKKSFDELISSRIADIMATCLSKLPKVIAMKCHTNVIEKREASVQAAAKLLGETKEMIMTLQEPSRHAPSMNPDDLSLSET